MSTNYSTCSSRERKEASITIATGANSAMPVRKVGGPFSRPISMKERLNKYHEAGQGDSRVFSGHDVLFKAGSGGIALMSRTVIIRGSHAGCL